MCCILAAPLASPDQPDTAATDAVPTLTLGIVPQQATEVLARRWVPIVDEVEDTGIGIAKDRQARLFDEFSQVHDQVHDGVTRNQGGNGLGLAIAARIVNLLGGQIAIASEPGRGSRFSFELTVAVTRKAIPPEAPSLVPLCQVPGAAARRDLPILPVDVVELWHGGSREDT